MSWETISFVNRSKNRKLILFKISKPTTPTTLSKELNLHRSVTSRALLDLEEKGLVTCLNPESKKERYYQVTKKGQEMKRRIERI